MVKWSPMECKLLGMLQQIEVHTSLNWTYPIASNRKMNMK